MTPEIHCNHIFANLSIFYRLNKFKFGQQMTGLRTQNSSINIDINQRYVQKKMKILLK